MFVTMARIFTIRCHDFRWCIIWDEPQNCSGLYVHHGGSDNDGCKSRFCDEELGVPINGSYLVLCRRIPQRICVLAAVNPILPETDFEDQTRSFCNLSYCISDHFSDYRIHLRSIPAHKAGCFFFACLHLIALTRQKTDRIKEKLVLTKFAAQI